MTPFEWTSIGMLLAAQAVGVIIFGTQLANDQKRNLDKINELSERFNLSEENIKKQFEESDSNMEKIEMKIMQSIDDLRKSSIEMNLNFSKAIARMEHDSNPGFKMTLEELQTLLSKHK